MYYKNTHQRSFWGSTTVKCTVSVFIYTNKCATLCPLKNVQLPQLGPISNQNHSQLTKAANKILMLLESYCKISFIAFSVL